jgi:putrescine transport system permease protein
MRGFSMTDATRQRRVAILALPWTWIVLFLLAPLALVIKLSLSQSAVAQPPYEPVFAAGDTWAAFVGKLGQLGFDAYRGLAADQLYWQSYVGALVIAGVSTFVTLLVAFPFAYAIAQAPPSRRPILLGLAMAPFWTSFLIRVYALAALIKNEGPLEKVLVAAGLLHGPLDLFATNGAIVLGIVYSYLPFMILPLYNALERQDPSLVEAARDLGATRLSAFARITVPLALPGIVAGCLLVFIPAVGEFVIPDLLGGSDSLMIGRMMWNEFFENRDWPTAAAAAIVLLLALLLPVWLVERRARRSEVRA